MKNIVVGILTIVTFAIMAWTASNGRAYHGGEHSKVIEDMGTKTASVTQQASAAPQDKSDREKEQEQLSALKEKAGNVGQIKVSTEYKSKCSACHGVSGSGMQDGRKLMGPKLYGQSAEKIYKDLIEFKAGRKENVIMKGLLINISEEELKKYADEIGAFPTLSEALNK
ncbi:MAG: c-type cytochrome [Sulfurimonas sp.]|jgi:cytochrome c553|uniref:c-type cytochrome n=1 Tax=unclassified Sulfurimonas TaxID=2623549 RepID=UPI0008CEACE7|nr:MULTISPECIES: c-type cytochrome [unclassified Sulfurimonas]OHE12491.1 MAG: hypothetical protein A2329_00195 [Sulfurimonas sp. RIFOXYB2_FULL_37_5]MBS4069404.1 c-type cytochrome [Sulfurimonas sp.]MDD3855781.1 c-type cytochrome [Sulfurimonas sp.]MDX9756725.1 c-type cytochrome [Sulfurimonas sp.]OHE06042.1 MAG: hypothetical protein A2345_05620 [Sulfurimonas sp. RIFOXYB12_FULL_35_9]